MSKENKFTPRQSRFIDEYTGGENKLNGTKSAIAAGFSEKTANEQAARLLAKVSIQEEIARRQAKIAKKCEISQEWVLKQLKRVYKRCMQLNRVYDKEGNFTGEFEFEPAGANKSLELLGKHLGMFAERIKLGGDENGQPIKAQLTVTAIESRIEDLLK